MWNAPPGAGPESARWEEPNARRRAVRAQQRAGASLEGVDAALTRFTFADMFLDKSVRPRLIVAFLMMLSVTFGFWGVATFVPTYVGTVADKAGLSAPYYSAVAGLLGTGVAIFGFITLGFLADWIGRKPTAMLYYAMCLILTPVVYLWAKSMGPLLVAVTVFGFFTGGIWAWAPVWLPELFPTRMRGTAVAFCFNAPRWISCIGPLIAGTLIVALGGYGRAATIVGLFFIIGVIAAPFLPETRGKPLPHALWRETPGTS
jgi:MFS family permease